LQIESMWLVQIVHFHGSGLPGEHQIAWTDHWIDEMQQVAERLSLSKGKWQVGISNKISNSFLKWVWGEFSAGAGVL
jgi:hypothetical protein